MQASRFGHEQVAHVLLKAGAVVSAQNIEGWTALMYAAQDGHKQVARDLLKSGASLKVVSIDNFTMLMAASHGGALTMVSKGESVAGIEKSLRLLRS